MTQIHWPRRTWSDARTLVLLVRLLEVAALLLLLTAAQAMWHSWGGPSLDQAFGFHEPPVLARAWSLVLNQFAPSMGIGFAALLLAASLLAIRGLRPLASAAGMRIELAALVILGFLLQSAMVVAVAVVAVVPYSDTLGPSPLAIGEDRGTVILTSAAWPTAALLAYVALGLGWSLLRSDADELAEAPPGPGGASAAADEQAGEEVVRKAGPPGVERLDPAAGNEPIDRLSPDGSTANGYDEFFRRT